MNVINAIERCLTFLESGEKFPRYSIDRKSSDVLNEFRVHSKLKVFHFSKVFNKNDCQIFRDFIQLNGEIDEISPGINQRAKNRIQSFCDDKKFINEQVTPKLFNVLKYFQEMVLQSVEDDQYTSHYYGFADTLTLSMHTMGEEIGYHYDKNIESEQIFKFIIYSSEFENGATQFVIPGNKPSHKNDVSVKGEMGDVVVFMIDGHYHCGGRITKGTKYMLGLRMTFK
eukprot:30803_1